MSPGFIVAPRSRITVRIDSLIDPRCTGICGAFATNPPAASNTAHEKSSRSRMFTDEALVCSARPISSATPMKRLLKTSSRTGSTRVPIAAPACAGARRVSTRSPSVVIAPRQPGSMNVVAPFSRTSAGPSTLNPAGMSPRRNTGALNVSPASRMSTTASGEGSRTAIVTLAFGGVSSSPTASAESFATMIARDASRNPNRERCAVSNASRILSSAARATGSEASAPS